MSEYVKLATGAGDQYLAALAELQDGFLRSAAVFPVWTLAAFPAAALLWAAELPTPRQILETNFTFTEKLLKQQRDFVEKFFGVTALGQG